MFRRLAIIGLILALAGYGASTLLSALPPPIHGEPPEESWRRTNSGWEKFSPRVVADFNPARQTATIGADRRDSRLDFHPAVLSLLLGWGAAGACLLLPRHDGPIAQRQSQSLF